MRKLIQYSLILFICIFSGCGYKTDPIYIDKTEQNKQ